MISVPEFAEHPTKCHLPKFHGDKFFGSAQEFVETRILGCFLKSEEFDLCDRHALSLAQQVGEILVVAAPSKKSLDVAVDGFHHTETYFAST